ncbi:MAG: exopolysaccharide biosynthesis polyprenyl glycosylphosphotransferase [Armatimonadetes bacterium]|nr:exopolysaccharide biosynthesis polyprenyl glycosylphosphotransferase [Armatimonadota bacterium]
MSEEKVSLEELRMPVAQSRIGYRIAKRLIDIVGSAVLLLLLAPLFLVIAICIRLDSCGPVVFRQTRLGLGGKPFTFYKFRSMCTDAEESRKKILHMNEVSGPVFKIKQDPRVTRVGKWLRRYSIDELPQLFNVLKGNMSFVGPRPPLPDEVRRYEKWQLERLSVVPGITCLWQVSGRSKLSFDEWVQLDLKYINSRSILLDFRILLKTIPAVISGEGAY